MVVTLLLLLIAIGYLSIKVAKLQRDVNERLTKEELEASLERFLQDVKEDNEAVVHAVQNKHVHTETPPPDSKQRSVSNILPFEHRLKEGPIEPVVSEQLNVEVDHMHKKVHQLKSEGVSSIEIAKELAMGVREVELILNLTQRKQK
ncbi:DUF6115 domain-containing protein [Shouchella sp. JSM 1781072]|uniref:DUF6115 domain-containing protein n=1 Tax=Bacillaceae TaxID=186817 RepID=UPI000C077484|nr:hypothetical protein [Bacillus sp. Marseille-P3800]